MFVMSINLVMHHVCTDRIHAYRPSLSFCFVLFFIIQFLSPASEDIHFAFHVNN